jgi:hypothetical protein
LVYYGYIISKFGKPVPAAAGFFMEFLKKSRFLTVRHSFGLSFFVKTSQSLIIYKSELKRQDEFY